MRSGRLGQSLKILLSVTDPVIRSPTAALIEESSERASESSKRNWQRLSFSHSPSLPLLLSSPSSSRSLCTLDIVDDDAQAFFSRLIPIVRHRDSSSRRVFRDSRILREYIPPSLYLSFCGRAASSALFRHRSWVSAPGVERGYRMMEEWGGCTGLDEDERPYQALTRHHSRYDMCHPHVLTSIASGSWTRRCAS